MNESILIMSGTTKAVCGQWSILLALRHSQAKIIAGGIGLLWSEAWCLAVVIGQRCGNCWGSLRGSDRLIYPAYPVMTACLVNGVGVGQWHATSKQKLGLNQTGWLYSVICKYSCESTNCKITLPWRDFKTRSLGNGNKSKVVSSENFVSSFSNRVIKYDILCNVVRLSTKKSCNILLNQYRIYIS